MVGVDTNILIYAFRKDLPQHEIAAALIDNLMAGQKPWAVTWPSLYEFCRVVTHPKIFKSPSTRKEALAAINLLIKIKTLHVLSHGSAHIDQLLNLATGADATGNFFFDVQIAAILLENGVAEVITNDGDFLRFRGLKVTNPFN